MKELATNAMMDFDAYSITLAIFFSIIGYAAWRYGRKTSSTRHIVLAVALMAFPYVVSQIWWMALIGGLLIVLLFWP